MRHRRCSVVFVQGMNAGNNECVIDPKEMNGDSLEFILAEIKLKCNDVIVFILYQWFGDGSYCYELSEESQWEYNFLSMLSSEQKMKYDKIRERHIDFKRTDVEKKCNGNFIKWYKEPFKMVIEKAA